MSQPILRKHERAFQARYNDTHSSARSMKRGRPAYFSPCLCKRSKATRAEFSTRTGLWNIRACITSPKIYNVNRKMDSQKTRLTPRLSPSCKRFVLVLKGQLMDVTQHRQGLRARGKPLLLDDPVVDNATENQDRCCTDSQKHVGSWHCSEQERRREKVLKIISSTES